MQLFWLGLFDGWFVGFSSWGLVFMFGCLDLVVGCLRLCWLMVVLGFIICCFWIVFSWWLGVFVFALFLLVCLA